MRLLALFLRLALGLVFLAASADKLLHPADFAQVVLNYRILPGTLVAPAAVILPWVELLCGLALVLGWMAPGAALTAVLLLLVFTGAEISALWRGLDIACGCFSADPDARGGLALALARDAGLLLLALATLATQLGQRKNTERR